MLSITVYEKPSCMQCIMTKRRFDSASVLYASTDVTEDSAAYEFVNGQLGYQAAPVVVVRKDGVVVVSWAGFNLDAIDRWSRAVTGILVPVAA